MAARLFLGRKSNTFTFFCLIENDMQPIVVSIDRDQTISMLKIRIYEARKNRVAGVDPVDLMLFKDRNGSGTQL